MPAFAGDCAGGALFLADIATVAGVRGKFRRIFKRTIGKNRTQAHAGAVFFVQKQP